MSSTRSGWPPSLRRLGRRLTRGLRGLVVVLAVLGLTPIAALVDHLLADTAALAAAPNQAGCADDCPKGCEDAGCQGDLHCCACCPAGARALMTGPRLNPSQGYVRAPGLGFERPPPTAIDAPPLPPPRV